MLANVMTHPIAIRIATEAPNRCRYKGARFSGQGSFMKWSKNKRQFHSYGEEAEGWIDRVYPVSRIFAQPDKASHFFRRHSRSTQSDAIRFPRVSRYRFIRSISRRVPPHSRIARNRVAVLSRKQ